ncbi:MAG TPA: hypothetical protein VGV59_04160 [Pyrinomonadaceae bacterium]|nr:hypothetical protein [Pyrinomonadaceae bacterium]
MRKTHVLKSLLVLIGLPLLVACAYAQPGDYEKRRPPSGLHPVYRDEPSGERRFGFIDRSGKLVIKLGDIFEEKYGYIDRTGRFIWRLK